MHPILFTWAGHEFRSYSVLLVAGVLAALLASRALARRAGVPVRRITDFLFCITLCGALGLAVRAMVWQASARIAPLDAILQGWANTGGAAMGPVFVGSMLGAGLYARVARVRLGPLLDIALPAWMLGLGVLRWGCWLNGCCYGRPTSSLLALYAPDLTGQWAYRYPTQIIESIFCVALFGVLTLRSWRRAFDGVLGLSVVMAYAAFRFGLAFLRGDNYYPLDGLAESQLHALVALVLGAVLWRHLARKASAARHPATTIT